MPFSDTVASALIFVLILLVLIDVFLLWASRAMRQAREEGASRLVAPDKGQHVRIVGRGDKLFVVMGPEVDGWIRVKNVDGPPELFLVCKDSILAPKSNL